jgi:hypothetical protein
MLDRDVRDRIEHNLKYKDETIFENISIFKDLDESNNKVSGRKDKFDARSLLSQKIEDIISEEDTQDLSFKLDFDNSFQDRQEKEKEIFGMSFKDQSADISMLRELEGKLKSSENNDFNRQICSPGDLSLSIENKLDISKDFKKEQNSPMLNS